MKFFGTPPPIMNKPDPLDLILISVNSLNSLIGQLGAYGLTFRTKFNGFYSDSIFEVQDQPIMSMYDKEKDKAFLVA